MTPPDPPRASPRRGRAVDVGALYESLESAAPAPAKVLANRLGMRFVLVPPGAFRMGSPEPAPRRNEAPARDVILSAGFYLGEFPVANRDLAALDPKGGWPADDRPAVNVSWDAAVESCAKLSTLGGGRYRLPTEAEWEYACRAGTETAYSTGGELPADQAAFRAAGADPAGGPPPAGSLAANSFGLFGMHGGVWEWCADWLGTYPPGQARDPLGPASGRFRVLRGGSYSVGAECCRSAYRNALEPHQCDSQTGFRVVLVPGD